MKCPACENQMEEMTVADITVDVCNGGCGGLWFDQFELQKVDEPHESAGEKLLDIERDEGVRVDHSEKRMCPKCEGTVMMRHFYSVKKEEEGKLAAQEYFEEIFGNQLRRMREESEEKLQKAKKIAHIFRFICPSYYIPGKQDWGAF